MYEKVGSSMCPVASFTKYLIRSLSGALYTILHLNNDMYLLAVATRQCYLDEVLKDIW
jgi:hypothetical protein